jgi:hypothetical protein
MVLPYLVDKTISLSTRSPTLDKWLKKATADDTGLTRPPTVSCVTLSTVTNDFMGQYTIPIDTNQLTKLPSRDDVETLWMINDQVINLRSNWSDREKTYSELSVSLGQVDILQMGVRRGVSSDSDEQVRSTSRRTGTQTNTDKDEMEEVVDEENVEDVEEGEGEGEGEEEEEEEESLVENVKKSCQ